MRHSRSAKGMPSHPAIPLPGTPTNPLTLPGTLGQPTHAHTVTLTQLPLATTAPVPASLRANLPPYPALMLLISPSLPPCLRLPLTVPPTLSPPFQPPCPYSRLSRDAPILTAPLCFDPFPDTACAFAPTPTRNPALLPTVASAAALNPAPSLR